MNQWIWYGLIFSEWNIHSQTKWSDTVCNEITFDLKKKKVKWQSDEPWKLRNIVSKASYSHKKNSLLVWNEKIEWRKREQKN